MSGAMGLPEGFTLDEAPAAMPTLPAGFTVDVSHPVSGPSGSLMTDVGRRAGTAGTEALGAFLGLPRAAAQGVDWLTSRLPGVPENTKVQDFIGSLKQPTGDNRPLFPDPATAREMAYKTTGATEYVPETYWGRIGQAALNAVPFGLGGGLRMIPGAMGGGATSEMAGEWAADRGWTPAQQFFARLAGGVPGQVGVNAATNGAARLAAVLAGGAKNEPYAAFERLGLPRELGGTVTGEPSPVYAEKFAARMPGSEGKIADARARLVAGWQNKLDETANSLGSATTPAEAGISLQRGAKDWLSNFKTATGKLWNDFHTMVPGTTPVTVSNYESALKNVLGDYTNAPATGRVLQAPTARALSDALGVDLPPSGHLTWDALRTIRTAIGEKLDSPSIIADTSQAALKQIYAGLTRDMEAGAGNVSPRALSAFHRANAVTAAGHDLLDNHIAPVINAASPEAAAQFAMQEARLGGSRLGALTFNIPGAAGDLGALALRQAATNTESPTSLATAIAGRKPAYSPEAMNVLFPKAETRATINDLARTGESMRPFEKDLANSPTATHQARGLGRLVTAMELGRLGHEYGGAPGRIAGMTAGMMAPNLLGKIAEWTALNPRIASFYATQAPFEMQSLPPSIRALIAAQPNQAAPFSFAPQEPSQ